MFLIETPSGDRPERHIQPLACRGSHVDRHVPSLIVVREHVVCLPQEKRRETWGRVPEWSSAGSPLMRPATLQDALP